MTNFALNSQRTITWQDALPTGLTPDTIHFGRDESGIGQVQIAVAHASTRPTKALLEAAWKTRGANTTAPVLVVAIHGDNAWLYEHTFEPVGPISTQQAARRIQSILDEPDSLSAFHQLDTIMRSLATQGGGSYTNHFLFAGYHLRTNVPKRKDWRAACQDSTPLLTQRGQHLIQALGFEPEAAPGTSHALVLRAASGQRRALAVLLTESESFDQRSPAYPLSPVAHGLELASREGVPWVIFLRKGTLRLYPGTDGVGVGQRGQSETYFELNLDLLDPDDAGYLSLVFSASALEQGGSADEILHGSGVFAAQLGLRLRDRVYDRAVPTLAVSIAERLPASGVALDATGLQFAYSLTLRVLFRVLFQAYAEDSGLLPADRNEWFKANSLQAFVAREATTPHEDFSETATSIWQDLRQVWDAVYNGNPRWEVPAYGGSLFDPATREGAFLKSLELPDSVMGPTLQAILTDLTEEGVPGAVDFRSLQVREFGTIYEGLLESSLSLAAEDLTLDKNKAYVPAKGADAVVAAAGQPYFHSASGERKATGSYFTPKIVVDHLIERSIQPALDAHLDKVKVLLDASKDREAADLFWDFRVADLAMGSAHFLVAAIDKIERGMRDFLTANDVPGVMAELSRLAERAKEQLGADTQAAEAITQAQLLRRQVARRCVYGLDINPFAVELARLAIWIHTFVPGLPMSSLEHGLVVGNSLTGIGSIEEALDVLVGEDLGPTQRRMPHESGSPSLFDAAIDGPQESGYRRMLRAALNGYIADVLPLLDDVANADEASKSESQRASHTLAEARERVMPVKRILDAAVAGRMGWWDPQISRPEHVAKLAEADDASSLVDHLQSAHMPYVFPEVFVRENSGFDVLVGNPPWEKVRWEAAPFWSKVSAGLMALPDSQRDTAIETLRVTRPMERERELAEMARRAELQELFKRSYEWRGGSHLELSQLMLERALKLVRKGGTVGLVLPRQLLVLAGWARLREVLFENWDTTLVQARNHGGWLFEGVDNRYAAVFLSASPRRDGVIAVGVAGDEGSLASIGAVGATSVIPVNELSTFSAGLAVPWFEAPVDRLVFDKLRAAERLGNGEAWVTGRHDSRWDFRRTGRHSKFASEVSVPEASRVLMTRHVIPYGIDETALFKQWIRDPRGLAGLGRGYQVASEGGEFEPGHPAIIFRHPSRSDDTRTLIATGLPDSGYIYNAGSVHAVAHDPACSDAAVVALIGVMNSAPVDWWVRRFADRHVTAPIINNLPLPSLTPDEVNECASLAATLLIRRGTTSLAGIGSLDTVVKHDHQHVQWTDNDLIAAIECLVSRGFGLDGADYEVIASDFTEKGLPVPARRQVLEVLTEGRGLR